jgi:O-antigen ligase
MGVVLSVLYFITYYLTPATVFGPLAAFRIELILAAIILFVSLPALMRSFIGKTPQTLALIGLAFAVLLSVVIGEHWPGGGVQAFLSFIPNAFAYFLVCLHCNSKKKLRVLVLMLVGICLFVIAHGANGTLNAPEGVSPNGEMTNPYVLAMGGGESVLYRLRGLGEINDPNDFAQLIVCTIPLVFIFWTPKHAAKNFLCVLLPVCALLFGAFLTHSRGAMLAILAMAVVAGRRRIGTIPSLLLAAGLFAGASALNFTGGRDISANAGSDRTALWGTGLELLKSHPLFGVGFGNFADYAGLTAHNSVVVCAAELGMFGLYFWALFLFPTMRDALAIASPEKVTEVQPVIIETARFPQMQANIEAIDKADVNRLGHLMVVSLTGFLVAAWFLSRAFILTLFLLGGMAEVVFEMALRRGMISPRLPLTRVLRNAGGLAITLVLLMYILLRTVNLMH